MAISPFSFFLLAALATLRAANDAVADWIAKALRGRRETKRIRAIQAVLICWIGLIHAATAEQPAPTTISKASQNENGFLVHQVRSPYQAGTTQIKVLLPSRLESNRKYPVVYILPVEAANEHRWGNGLLAAKKAELHERHQVILVSPTFSHLPWYADHPTDLSIRQESYFVRVVVPFIDRSYPTKADASGRSLAGFSKSGWGAFSLLLRHEELFERAAAFDSPLAQERPNQFGMGPIFGTQANFKQYQITELLKEHAPQVRKRNRFILLGYRSFRAHHQQVHSAMLQLGIEHRYRDGSDREHHFDGSWLPEAVSLLLKGS